MDSNKPNAFTKWFNTFLSEKNLPCKSWDITVGDTFHIIDSDVVIEAIKNAPAHEQKGIKNMLVRIDFQNGDVLRYFKHLAHGLIMMREVQ